MLQRDDEGQAMSTKQSVLRLIERLPEDVALFDIMEELYTRQAIDEGLRELDEGKGVPQEEAERKLAKWVD
jgi:predicted transcriptional regulator